jgi:hypothetical protein
MFIAPNVPHYFCWSPAGDAVSYVSATERGLELSVTSLDGAIAQHRIAVGAPLFHAWSPDGASVAAHAGSEVLLFELATRSTTEIHHNGAGFRTPRFLPNGALLYATPGGSGIALMSRQSSGDTRQLAVFDGGVAFVPVGDVLLVGVTHQPDASLFDTLWRVSTDGSERALVARGPFAAYWGAPGGEVVVLMVPSHSGDGAVSLQARALSGETVAATAPFVPSADMRVAVAFFDQYALSHSPWSPQGEQFVACGRFAGDGVSGSFGDPAGDYVMLWRPERSQPLEVLMPGTLGSFPPSGTAGNRNRVNGR